MLLFCDTDLPVGSLSLLWYADSIHFHSICVLCCPSFGQQSSIGDSWILCFSHTTSWCSMKALHQKVPPKKKATIRRMFMAIFWNIFYFLVATSQVRTNSSIKSSFSFHSDERAFVPQQERWFLRSSRFALCNNPIDAFIWWATSAQYTSSSIIFWTLASVPIAFLILSCILSFEIIILKIILKNPMISVYLIYFLVKVPPASAGFYVLIFHKHILHRKNKSRRYMDCKCIFQFS